MNKNIPIQTAKTQLVEINKVLDKPHALIGGLAVQHYYVARESEDIDLVITSGTARRIIEKLYSNKDWNTTDKNDDEYRPAFEITSRIDNNKVVFLGPKIIEREEYESISWSSLLEDSEPFTYQNQELENIRVPRLETLAFTKLLSFINRISKDKRKGEKDLVDFINLTNQVHFRINILIDHIRQSHIEAYINSELAKMQEYNHEIWKSSLFLDFINIISPVVNDIGSVKHIFEDNYERLYQVDESIDFYNQIANLYDERNTSFVADTHKGVIRGISDAIEGVQTDDNIKILDIGAGTGRLIAAHFFNQSLIEWHAVEPSKKMAKKFSSYLKADKLNYKLFDCSVFELDESIINTKYDVIVMSLVLSSLHETPDFTQIASLLKDNGVLIIADFNESNPFYDFQIESEKIALYIKQLPLLHILRELVVSNLQIKSLELIDNDKSRGRTFIMTLQNQK